MTATKRSWFLSVIAWLSILGGAFGTLASLLVAFTQPTISGVVFLADSIAYFVVGFGLRARREWARRTYIVVLAYTALVGFVSALRFHFPTASEMQRQAGGSPPPLTQAQIDAISAQMRPMIWVATSISAIIAGFLILWLRSQRIRYEFNPDSAPEGYWGSEPPTASPVASSASVPAQDPRARQTGWPPII